MESGLVVAVAELIDSEGEPVVTIAEPIASIAGWLSPRETKRARGVLSQCREAGRIYVLSAWTMHGSLITRSAESLLNRIVGSMIVSSLYYTKFSILY
jgi:hypothetical protein